MLTKEKAEYFIPIIEVSRLEYRKDVDDIVSYIESEAERIKLKGCELILVEHRSKKSINIMLCRKRNVGEWFLISKGYPAIRDQQHKIVEIMKMKSTKVLKEY